MLAKRKDMFITNFGAGNQDSHEPAIFSRKAGFLPDRSKNFLGAIEAVPSELSPNEFGAQVNSSSTTG
jgi:hypothetical protein